MVPPDYILSDYIKIRFLFVQVFQSNNCIIG